MIAVACRSVQPVKGAPVNKTAEYMTFQDSKFDYIRHGAEPPALSGIASAFIGFWRRESRRAGKLLPSKADFTIQRLKPFLPAYYLAEWTGGDLINRLIGSELDRQLGETLTGHRFLSRYSGTQRAYFEALWPILLSQPCGIVTVRTRFRGDGSGQRIEGVALPLANSSGEPNYICGVGTVENIFEARSAKGVATAVIDYVRCIDVGAGLPENLPDPALFNQSAEGVWPA